MLEHTTEGNQSSESVQDFKVDATDYLRVLSSDYSAFVHPRLPHKRTTFRSPQHHPSSPPKPQSARARDGPFFARQRTVVDVAWSRQYNSTFSVRHHYTTGQFQHVQLAVEVGSAKGLIFLPFSRRISSMRGFRGAMRNRRSIRVDHGGLLRGC
jgi:hypothetical protein